MEGTFNFSPLDDLDFELGTTIPSSIDIIKVDGQALPVVNKTVNIDLATPLSRKQDKLVSRVNIKTVNGNSLLGSGNIEIQGGAGNVNSVNGKTGNVVLRASDIRAQNSQTIQDNLERIDDTAEQTIDDLADVEAIAKGAQQAISYSDYEAFVTAFNDLDGTEYNAGQNVMIITLEVPDLWISSVEETSVPYTYTSDQDFIDELSTAGYVQVGYYRVSQLETAKVDLTNYVKNTDYASTSVAGIIRAGASYGTQVSGMFLQGRTRTYAQYITDSGTLFLCKGTLENVIDGKGIRSTWTGTQAEFNALTTYDDNTDYRII